jgi:hypothetical protein
MAHKRALEALDRTTKDLRSNITLFGGAMIVLVPLWQSVKKMQLTKKKLQVSLQNDLSAETFPNQLLTIGNGRVPDDNATRLISFPPNFYTLTDTKEELITNVFPNMMMMIM